MDYEKKYRDLVEAVKKLQEANPSDEGIQNWVNDNVPELAESEDERISREITEFILTHRIDEPNDIEDTNTWLAWLEKQGQVKESQISQHENKTCKENDNSLTYEDGIRIRDRLVSLIKEIKRQPLLEDWDGYIAWLEKQGEQKPKWEQSDDIRFSQLYDFLVNKTPRLQVDCNEYAAWLNSLKQRML